MKLKLDTSQMASDFFDDTRILGIVAPVKDYHLCWELNQVLRVDFRLNHDLEIRLHKKNRQYFFSVYEYGEPAGALRHYLYSNHCDGEYLLSEFRHLDYLWLLKGDFLPEKEWTALQQGIRSVGCVQLVTELAEGSIRNKQHLIF